MTSMRQVVAIQHAVIDELERLSELSLRAGARSLHRRVVDDRLPRLREERLVLVVLGEFNHGKTTFVNALLGGDVLPTGITPTTAVIHEVRYGESPSAEQVLRADDGDVTGERLGIEWSRLGEWAVGGGAKVEGTLRVELAYPSALLKERVTLVDTPGVNDLNQLRAEITYGYVPRADAVVFLLDAGQVLKDSERMFLRDKLLSSGRDRIVFAVNKCDLLDASEREQVETYVRATLAGLVPDAQVVMISAVRERQGNTGASGFRELREKLGSILGEHRLRTLVDYGADEGARVATMLVRSLEVRRRAVAMSAEEIERKVAAFEADLVSSQSRMVARSRLVDERIAVIRAVALRDVEAFGDEFAGRIAAQIDAQSADDVRKHLAAFIEDTWRTWIEEKGRAVGAQLEELAEQIVAIVNEDARESARRLDASLGSSASDVDVRVDTLAYDVGVVALGAFGMSLMVASNLLVGGLLTLAAPLLALVFRERVDRQVKTKAIANAPDVIRSVARRIAPELGATIDGFGGRLSEFAMNASEEMCRSVIEVLNDTRAALATAQAAGHAPLAEVDGWLVSARGAAARFEELRAGLWQDDDASATRASKEGGRAPTLRVVR